VSRVFENKTLFYFFLQLFFLKLGKKEENAKIDRVIFLLEEINNKIR